VLFSSMLGPNASADTIDVTQLVNMPLEDILNRKVTSVAGYEQKVNDVADAMYVITGEDIQRWGWRWLADLLYRVPGMQIRHMNGYYYGVGMREDGDNFARDLLVLVDGAIVFNGYTAGSRWDTFPVSPDEVDHIEIIRGAPGVLYSSNAVDGVVNIITKTADTKNNYVSQGGGTQSDRDSNIGLGVDKLGSTGLAFRTYFDNHFTQGFTKFDSTSSLASPGSGSNKYLSDTEGGRMDYTPTDHQRLSVIVANKMQSANFVNYPSPKDSGQIFTGIVNYTDKVTDMYDYSLHIDHVDQFEGFLTNVDNIEHTDRLTTQHNFHYNLLGSQITSVGADLRYASIHTRGDNALLMLPTGKTVQRIFSFFLQDEYRPIEKLILTAGLREDTNTVTIGHKPLYSEKVSALYHFTDAHSLWVSSSHTYRTPSLEETQDLAASITQIDPLKPEDDYTQEVGYRGIFLDHKLKAEATLFYKKTSDVIIEDFVDTFTTANNGSVTTRGVELNLDYRYSDNLSLSTDYSYLDPLQKLESDSMSIWKPVFQSASKNVFGAGVRYTIHKVYLDLYAKYFQGYKQNEEVLASIPKIRGYYKSFLRISYDFKIPGWKGRKLDATVYVQGIDLVNMRQHEDAQWGVFMRPEVDGGIKIKF
jgi:iron complex outermembrane receptor protein